MEKQISYEELQNKNNELQWRLDEANEMLEAIRTGQVDALIVKNGDTHNLYTLKTADHTYRVFIEKMSEGAVTIDEGGFILYCNSSFTNLVQASAEKVIGIPFIDFVAEESKAGYKKVIKKAWKKDVKEELTITGGNNKITCCLCSFAVIDMDWGHSLSVILTDLTTQKAAQKHLISQNEKLEAAQGQVMQQKNDLEAMVIERTKDLSVSRGNLKLLADHITQMTWTCMPDGRVNFFNERWYEYTGLGLEQSMGWGWCETIHPDDIENFMDKYREALHTGGIFEVENRYRRGKDGVYRWHLNRAMPLKNENNEIILWVGTATDIEEQKRELERKDEFIGVASHELKTPLTSLKGYLQLILLHKKDDLPEAVKQYINKAVISLGKLQFLVDDLLDMSKIKAGRLSYNMDVINLKDVVTICADNAIHMNPTYMFEVENTEDFMIKGNAERIEQVLMNLINNAVKYSNGSRTVIIKSFKHADCARVSVTDFGIGLSDEQRLKIFERFYRVEDKKNMTSGLGMGLYISSEIINTHNGKIGVESKLGEGSTFYFDLPLVEAQ
ncbi:MAG: PAS domain S-box protein [Bacteroidetes bacterium]|jgi:two-component system CheB/CheR fusion protein|nr:PAS domain S-box protein [Bacteroidota bacterium]